MYTFLLTSYPDNSLLLNKILFMNYQYPTITKEYALRMNDFRTSVLYGMRMPGSYILIQLSVEK